MTSRLGAAPVPDLDYGTRRRLTARFGPEIGTWFDGLPDVLNGLAGRWQLEWGSLIPRGSMSVVIRCATRDGRPVVLKVSPDHVRLTNEAAALAKWTTSHTPSVLALEEGLGALLLEGIEPGTPLVESLTYPGVETTADLLTSLHATGAHDASYPPLTSRVAHLFDSGSKPYSRHPALVDLISPDLYERGRLLATRLAASVPPTALLHGDLTPSNILDGGPHRGLVAIDPAPCLGDDVSFDAIDLVLWQADDVDTISSRLQMLAPAIGVDASHLFDWCVAFAAMVALELAEAPDVAPNRVRAYMALAVQAPEA
jgi:streptomycin 6-kinase